MVGRFAIGLVLLVAGAAKLRQPAWPATAKAFGAPRLVVPVLPWTELGIGALLLAGVGLPWTAGVAVALVVAFTVAVARNLRRGVTTPCGCFGETAARPVGTDTLVRNLALCPLAASAAINPSYGGTFGAVAGLVIGALFVAAARVSMPSGRG